MTNAGLQGCQRAGGRLAQGAGGGKGECQAVVSACLTSNLSDKQYDVAVTWTSGQGEMSEGYTRGNLRSMVDRKMLKMSDINVIWQSGKIPNGPWAVRTALPADLKASFAAFLLDLPKAHPKVYDDVEQGAGVGYVPATMELYQDIIDLRLAERRGNRS
jgi:phosphonate transport system substrate-binding protein